MRNKFSRYIGQDVYVKWHDPYDDWPTYRVLAIDGGDVWLRGIDTPDGTPHDGTSFIARSVEAKTVRRIMAVGPVDTPRE